MKNVYHTVDYLKKVYISKANFSKLQNVSLYSRQFYNAPVSFHPILGSIERVRKVVLEVLPIIQLSRVRTGKIIVMSQESLL